MDLRDLRIDQRGFLCFYLFIVLRPVESLWETFEKNFSEKLTVGRARAHGCHQPTAPPPIGRVYGGPDMFPPMSPQILVVPRVVNQEEVPVISKSAASVSSPLLGKS